MKSASVSPHPTTLPKDAEVGVFKVFLEGGGFFFFKEVTLEV